MQKLFTIAILLTFLVKVSGQSTAEYIPDWTFYFTNVDNKLTSISTDLNLTVIAPIKGQVNIAYLSINMLNPREDGLSNKLEAEKLWDIEDEIVRRIDQEKLNCTFVGRLTSDGLRDLYFFGENMMFLEKQVSEAMEVFPEYRYEFDHKPDNEWNSYFNFLFPIPRQMQAIQNRRVIQQLQASGDDIAKEREVFHWIYFKDQASLAQYENFAIDNGYKILEKEEIEMRNDYKLVIKISRIDKVGYNDINNYTLELWDKAQELNADYDGWETSVEK